MSNTTPDWWLWRAQHQGKRRFPTRWHARKAIVCMIVRHREPGLLFLHPYTCTWTNGPHPTRDGVPHIHVGHDRQAKAKWRRRLFKYSVWPFYRVRLRVKVWLGYSDHQFYKRKKK